MKMITNDDNISSEFDRYCDSFVRQFEFMYHKLNHARKDMLKILFGKCCAYFIGLEDWFEILSKERSIIKIGIAHHKVKKSICGVTKWDSNHTACDCLVFPLFKHFLMKKNLIYIISACNSKSAYLGTSWYQFIYGYIL